jgi:hypothetical protein
MTALYTETTSQLALKAALQLHADMADNDAFAGYEADVETFTRLAEECLYIAENQLLAPADDVDDLTYQYYLNQTEIGEGLLAVDYYLQ